ncbi:hypothetical protein ACPSTI_004326, partial [Escherichia coli]
QKKLIMLPSETMIWQPEFTDKTLSRKPGAVHVCGHTLFIESGKPQTIKTGDENVFLPLISQSVSTFSKNLAFSFSSIRITSNTYQIFTVKFR